MTAPTCTATNRQGLPCGNSPMKGQRVCRLHGGKQPAALAKAAERQLEAKAQGVLARLGDPTVHPSPIIRLRELAAEADQFRGAVLSLIREMKSMRYSTSEGGEQLRAEIVVYERAIDRTIRAYAEIVKLGIEERAVAIDRENAQRVVRGLLAVLDFVKVPQDQSDRALEIFLTASGIEKPEGAIL